MNKELTAQLNEKYPKMFLFHNFRAANHFIFECGDGWYNIINAMLSSTNEYVQHNNNRFNKFIEAQDLIDNGHKDKVPHYLLVQIEKIKNGDGEYPTEMDFPVVQQVKEKFGTLRVYMSGYDDTVAEIIGFAETMSNTTCEECGNIGVTGNHNGGISGMGWIKTLCDEDAIKRQEEIKKRDEVQDSFIAGIIPDL